jgi:hypothetical protein
MANVIQSPVSALRAGDSPVGSRKPSGPRPLSSSGQYSAVNANAGQSRGGVQGDMGMVKKTRFRGSPYHISDDSFE